MSLEKTISAKGIFRFSVNYLDAYFIIKKSEPQWSKLFEVKYYLVCHSMELMLKSYLRDKGYSRKQLLEFGHDLMELALELKNKFSFPFQKSDMAYISNISSYYATKQFEYIQTGYKIISDLDEIEEIVVRVRTMIGPIIYKKGQ